MCSVSGDPERPPVASQPGAGDRDQVDPPRWSSSCLSFSLCDMTGLSQLPQDHVHSDLLQFSNENQLNTHNWDGGGHTCPGKLSSGWTLCYCRGKRLLSLNPTDFLGWSLRCQDALSSSTPSAVMGSHCDYHY